MAGWSVVCRLKLNNLDGYLDRCRRTLAPVQVFFVLTGLDVALHPLVASQRGRRQDQPRKHFVVLFVDCLLPQITTHRRIGLQVAPHFRQLVRRPDVLRSADLHDTFGQPSVVLLYNFLPGEAQRTAALSAAEGVMGVDFALGGEDADEMAFVRFNSFDDFEAFLAAAQVPHVRVHNGI